MEKRLVVQVLLLDEYVDMFKAAKKTDENVDRPNASIMRLALKKYYDDYVPDELKK
ncbi:hypothetical protein LCGC14_0194390 [marine sediment metagenome]|uniref:Uncharacterized protein n=1 Tax=marine sediment metagenome TaxID=412755 RepID=A0A0F9V1L2_9ZZZZ